MIIINESECNKDGICDKECPIAIIHMDAVSGLPVINKNDEKYCINCGHCVAVCPTGALDHPKISIDDCTPVSKELNVSIEQVEQFLQKRRSIRFYKKKPIEKEKIQKTIDMVRYAPTGHNAESINWMVYTDPEQLKKITDLTGEWMKGFVNDFPEIAESMGVKQLTDQWEEGRDTILRGAPCVIVVQAGDQAVSGQQDCDIALSYFELAATAMDLGTCWCGLIAGAVTLHPPLAEVMGIKSSNYLYALLAGYPGFIYPRIPKRKAPKIQWY